MASILDRIKKSFTASTSKHSEAKGHRLGTREENEMNQQKRKERGAEVDEIPSLANLSTFSVEYTEEGSMGITVDVGTTAHIPVVSNVTQGSPSHKSGVQSGDIVVAVDDNRISNFDDFMAVIPSLGRPVTLTFARQNMTSNIQTGNTNAGSSSSSSSSTSSSSFPMMPSMISVFRAPSTTATNSAPPLSDQEKEQRREAMRLAAAQRASAWDKKVANGRKERNAANPVVDTLAPGYQAPSVEVNPETARLINEAKRREAAQVQAMGYDPFKPHMSFSGKGGTVSAPSSSLSSSSLSSSSSSSSASSSSPSSPSSSPRNPPSSSQVPQDFLEDDEELAASVDLCLSTFIASASSTSPDVPPVCDEAAIQTALVTANKMLTSLLSNPSEPKFRSVRVQNAAFQSKVASVPGAVDCMIAAGFQEVVEGDEVYLKHDASKDSMKKLQYVVARLKEFI